MTISVLYIEDHFNNMLLVKKVVEAEGHVFLTAAEGEAGWVMAIDHHPDLIFVDLRLPGEIDGYELLRRFKANPTLMDTPAIVLTAYGHGDAESRAKEIGCDGFLHKPADIQQIQAVIRHHVGPPIRQIDVKQAKPQSIP